MRKHIIPCHSRRTNDYRGNRVFTGSARNPIISNSSMSTIRTLNNERLHCDRDKMYLVYLSGKKKGKPYYGNVLYAYPETISKRNYEKRRDELKREGVLPEHGAWNMYTHHKKKVRFE